MGCFIFSSVACLALSYFSTFSHKQKKKSTNTFYVRFDFLYKFVWNIANFKKNSEIVSQTKSSCTAPVILNRFWRQLNLLDRFSKNPQISNLMKIRLVGAELFHTQGRTKRRSVYHDEVNSLFRTLLTRIKTAKNANVELIVGILSQSASYSLCLLV